MTTHFVNLLDELRRRSLRMASLVEDVVEEACDAVLEGNETLALRVVSRDEDVDREEVEVESEAVRLLALFQPVGVDLRLLCTILKVNNDLERIADCAVNMAERACHLQPHWVVDQISEMGQLCPVVRQLLRDAIRAYSSQDEKAANEVLGQDPMVDALYAQIIRGVIARASSSPANMASHLDLLSVAKNLERIADHATNIAEDVIYLCTGSIVRHRMQRRVLK